MSYGFMPSCKSKTTSFRALPYSKTAVAQFGFDTFACGEVDIAHRDRNVFYIIEWPDTWRKFYIGTGLIERDPMLGALSERRKSFTWSELRKDRKLSQVGRDAIQLAAEHGWTAWRYRFARGNEVRAGKFGRPFGRSYPRSPLTIVFNQRVFAHRHTFPRSATGVSDTSSRFIDA